MKLGRVGLIAVLMMVGGCSKKATLECAADSSTSTTIDLVKSELEKAVTKQLTGDDGTLKVEHSSIRATLAQLVISITDIRTTKVDPNSTKRFCAGTLKVKFPAQVLTDADTARSDQNMPSVSSLADNMGLDRNADTFSRSISYDVQPTDDGDKVYAETDDTSEMTNFFDQVIAAALIKPSIQQAKDQQQAQQQQVQQAQQAATDAQREADHEQAQTENQIAGQTIMAVWKNLPDPVRGQLLPDQRAWIKKKTADCAVQAASASTDPTEQDTARLRCDTNMTKDRTQQLGNIGNSAGQSQY